MRAPKKYPNFHPPIPRASPTAMGHAFLKRNQAIFPSFPFDSFWFQLFLGFKPSHSAINLPWALPMPYPNPLKTAGWASLGTNPGPKNHEGLTWRHKKALINDSTRRKQYKLAHKKSVSSHVMPNNYEYNMQISDLYHSLPHKPSRYSTCSTPCPPPILDVRPWLGGLRSLRLPPKVQRAPFRSGLSSDGTDFKCQEKWFVDFLANVRMSSFLEI